MSDALTAMVTALGDDELVIGHRHSEWTGFAPHIEEDVAFSSIAQDEIGHAAAYYSIISDDPDSLALGRKKNDYRNALLCERANGDWSFTLTRHWLYDKADALRLESLEGTSHTRLGELVTKLRREERYHVLHADAWMRRVARGPVEGRSKMIDAVSAVFPDAVGLFEPFELEDEAVKEGLLTVPSDELRARFVRATIDDLDALGMPTGAHAELAEHAEFVASSSGDLIEADEDAEIEGPLDGGASGLGGRRGRHGKEFDQLWDVMTSTYREHPGARW